MNRKKCSSVNLSKLRENAGYSVRGLAKELKINHATLLKWESTGKVSNPDCLPSLATLLGVSIEELLGLPKPRNTSIPSGKLGQAFQKVSQLPRSQQQRILATVNDMVEAHLARTES
jgi:transcriptional regulator with XRE-family HTH domain